MAHYIQSSLREINISCDLPVITCGLDHGLYKHASKDKRMRL